MILDTVSNLEGDAPCWCVGQSARRPARVYQRGSDIRCCVCGREVPTVADPGERKVW